MKAILRLALLVVVFAGFASHSARSAETELNIRVKLLQCGAQHEIEKSCRLDERCCVFLDNMQTASLSLADHNPDKTDAKKSAIIQDKNIWE